MRTLPAIVALAVLVSCNGESKPTGTDGPVGFSTVYRAKTSAVSQRRAEVISRQERWSEVWDEITAGQSPKPAIPAANFNDVLLIFAAGGQLADSCSDLRVETVNRVNGSLVVSMLEERRPATCTCPAVVVRPVHVVSVPRAATGAVFEFRVANLSGCP